MSKFADVVMPKFANAPKFSDSSEPTLEDFRPFTLGHLIQRYVDEMNGWAGKPPVREIGGSHLYQFRALQRMPIAKKDARKFTKHDIKVHCRARIDAGVKPPTVSHDLSCLSVVLSYAGSEWDDCDGISDAPVKLARPSLVKHGIVRKSEPRSRRPTPEELEILMWDFHFPRQRGKVRLIDMATLTWWQPASGRRVSESCRLLWADWDREAHTILVRKMKDPRNRNKAKVVALTDAAQAFLEAACEVRDPRQPRIFPYNARSAIAAYCSAKKRLGIEGLHWHDSRRETSSRLAEEGYSSAEAIQFTGHETPREYERTYLKLKPENMRHGPVSLRKAQRAA